MRRIFGLALIGGLVLASASSAKAQFGLNIGNPYANGVSIGVGNGYGYGYGYPAYGYSVARPGIYSYSSGYQGWAAPGYTYAAPVYGYRYATPVYGYRNYGYAPYRRGWVGGGWGRRGWRR